MISYHPIIQKLKFEGTYHCDVLRLDLLHAEISGNKWFKLNRNLEKAKSENLKTILTFGGAFSNHIAATAAACSEFNFKSIGIIRGEKTESLNPTLLRAKENGMELHFINRELYAQKDEPIFQNYIKENFGKCYVIPEGGNNKEGILGCMEILKPEWNYDYVFCACGTGTTFAGLLNSKKSNQHLIGISVLKGENKLPEDVKNILEDFELSIPKSLSGNEDLEKKTLEEDCIVNTYAFKGYAKYDQQLIDFKNEFESEQKFELDHIYTTKLFFAVFDLLKLKKLKKNSKLLIIHSGGLQGNQGFEERYHLIPKR